MISISRVEILIVEELFPIHTAGKQGERNKRLVWFQQGNMRNWRMQRFRGTSDTHISIARLEATLEPLNV